MQCSSLEKSVWSAESYSKLHTHLKKNNQSSMGGDYKKEYALDKKAVRIEDAGSFSYTFIH